MHTSTPNKACLKRGNTDNFIHPWREIRLLHVIVIYTVLHRGHEMAINFSRLAIQNDDLGL